MPRLLGDFKEMGERLASFHKKNNRFPADISELDGKSKILVGDPNSGISIDFPNQRIRYNFERRDFDLFGSPLHVFSLGLIPANRNVALEYDLITIQNMAEKL